MSSATSLSNDLANSSDLSNSPPNNQSKRKLFSIDSILSNGCNLKETEIEEELETENEILNLKLMKKSNHSVVGSSSSSSSMPQNLSNTNPYEQLFLQNIQNSSNFFKNCFLNQSTVALINAAATNFTTNNHHQNDSNNLEYQQQQQQQQKQNNFLMMY